MIKGAPVARHADIVGYGRMGRALSGSLARAGFRVRVWTPSLRGREAEGIELCEGPIPPGFPSGEFVFLAVSDRAIPTVARSLSVREGQIVAHLSGAAGLDVLEAAAACGAEIGSLHPLVSVPPGASELSPCHAAVDGTETARRALEDLAHALGLRPFFVPPEMRGLYHAAASLAANGLVALSSLAARLFERLGVARPEAVEALVPLLGSAVDALRSRGLPAALTGPVARGDAETVRRHLEVLESTDAEAVYRALMLEALALSRELGEASAEALDAIATLLKS